MRAHCGDIIVVEDDHSVNRAILRLLEAAGFRARAFESAEALLIEDMTQQPADCFVFDIHLPGMSGIDLYSALREAGVSAPVVIITAHDDAHFRQAATRIGAAAYIRKPFSSRALVAAVTAAMLREEDDESE
jgi:FixJ family two-component response regulator